MLRIRGLKARIINNGRRAALLALIDASRCRGRADEAFGRDQVNEELLEDWYRDRREKQAVVQLLDLHGMDDTESVAACSAVLNLDALVKLEALLHAAERRRQRVLQEMGSYRQEWLQKLRDRV
jgi:hypothetical protein